MNEITPLDRLLNQIQQGRTNPQAILVFGSDSALLESTARRLIAFWLWQDMERPVDFARSVDAQMIVPWGSGMQIKHSAINPDTTDPDPKFSGVPVREFFRTRPLMGTNKAVWFQQADRMNTKAVNAFLKLMEELPDYARVVLTTRHISRILPTIRSRAFCVAASIAPFDDTNRPESEMESVWAGNPGELQFIRNHAEPHRDLWEALVRIPEAPPVAALAFAEKTRKCAEALAEQADIATRDAQVYFVELISRWWIATHPEDPEVAVQAADLCRLIAGYANAPIGLDALFGTMLVHNRELADTVTRY